MTTTRNDPDDKITGRYLELYQALIDATKLDRLPAAEPLIHDVLYLDTLNWLHGKPGHGKSFIALDWACHVATGRPWNDHDTRPARVLYVVAEGAHGMNDRRQAWEIANDHQIPDGVLLFLPVAVQIFRDIDTAALARLSAELAPELIVIDTQARVSTGADENSARDMGIFIANLDQLRAATRACVVVVHHEARAGDSLRGSTALEGAATTVIRASKEGPIIRLDNPKQKDAPPFDPVIGRLIPVDLPTGRTSAAYSQTGVGVADLTKEAERKIVEVLREDFGSIGASASTLIETTGLKPSTFYRALKALVNTGIIRNAGTAHRTRYVLTETEPMT